MAWHLSDGTVVHKGGRVLGTSELSDALRLDIAAVKRGWPVAAPVGPMPGGMYDLDLDDEVTVDAWLRAQASMFGVDVERGPAIEHPATQVSDELPDDAVF